MTDNRFKDFPIDARFPSPGVDFRFAELGVDARFRDGLDTRFQGDTYGAFNPRTLFGPTDTGWVYDLSDMSTLFGEAAGITPVTAVGQPVGLFLDKSGRGNHRSQSVSLNRPTYARHPLGGIRNLLTRTEEFENAAWVKSGAGAALAPVVTANAGLAPDGTMTADRVQFNCVDISSAVNRSGLAQIVSNITLGSAYTSSIYIRAFNAGNIGSTVRITSDGVNNTVYTLTGDWQRVPISGNSALTSSNLIIETRGTFTGQTADVLIWGAQFEPGSTATAYQRVVSVFDVTEAGQPDLYYLSYDGLNDSLSTAPFAWGSDKATVVAGVRKLSDAAQAALVDFTNAGVGSGIFGVQAPPSIPATRKYNFFSGGTLAQAAITENAAFTAPITNVLTGIGDISGDRATLRVNGAQVAQSTADQGTGNYGTYPVFFGARAGTSLFLKGWEYSSFAINRLLTPNELSQIERYTAQRTGVTL